MAMDGDASRRLPPDALKEGDLLRHQAGGEGGLRTLTGQQEHRFAEALITEGAGPPDPPLHELIDGLASAASMAAASLKGALCS